MKKTFLLLLGMYTHILYANTYSTTAQATAKSKDAACSDALQHAKVLAMEEAGTMVFSNFNATTSDNNGKISKSNQHELITTALGVAKLKSKTEDVKVTPQYQFQCKINATFEIDQNELQQSLKDMVQKQQEQKKLSGYFHADGYSEENQSRYRAFSAAKLIAQRNLLEVIKGADITSLTKVSDGQIETDKIGKLLNGTLQGAEVVKKEYDSKTRSAHVVLRIKKQDVVDTLNEAL